MPTVWGHGLVSLDAKVIDDELRSEATNPQQRPIYEFLVRAKGERRAESGAVASAARAVVPLSSRANVVDHAAGRGAARLLARPAA